MFRVRAAPRNYADSGGVPRPVAGGPAHGPRDPVVREAVTGKRCPEEALVERTVNRQPPPAPVAAPALAPNRVWPPAASPRCHTARTP
jgi:hypothetical protein